MKTVSSSLASYTLPEHACMVASLYTNSTVFAWHSITSSSRVCSNSANPLPIPALRTPPSANCSNRCTQTLCLRRAPWGSCPQPSGGTQHAHAGCGSHDWRLAPPQRFPDLYGSGLSLWNQDDASSSSFSPGPGPAILPLFFGSTLSRYFPVSPLDNPWEMQYYNPRRQGRTNAGRSGEIGRHATSRTLCSQEQWGFQVPPFGTPYFIR